MRQPELTFISPAKPGWKMVFSRGSALRYPEHTHVASCTLTLVRRGVVCLRRGRTECVYPRGSVYAVARHEPHSPAYSDDFDCVSLCIDLQRCAALRREALQTRLRGVLRPVAGKGPAAPGGRGRAADRPEYPASGDGNAGQGRAAAAASRCQRIAAAF